MFPVLAKTAVGSSPVRYCITSISCIAVSLITPTSPILSGHWVTLFAVAQTNSPIFLLATASRMCCRPGMKRDKKPTVKCKPFSCAVLRSFYACFESTAIGFSTKTCFPASRDLSASCARTVDQVQTLTASTSLSFSICALSV